MKKPNGYGSVYRLHGNRRKPWAVRITVSRTDGPDGLAHYRYKYLGYYESREKAEIALARYREHPYDIDASKMTFEEVYGMWSSQHFLHKSKSTVNGYSAAYKCCADLYGMKFIEIRKAHLQNVIDTCGKNYPTLQRIKALFSSMYKYAMDNDICMKAYTVDITQYADRNPDRRERVPFSRVEVDRLWEYADANEYVTVILILIYTGCRINELLSLKKEDADLSGRYFDINKSKTRSGIRRVPIARKILPIMEHWMGKDSGFMICSPEGERLQYRNFYDSYWKPIMDLVGMRHTPHDTRHTCITMLKNAGVEERIIRKIVGHAGQGVTEAVYTHYELQQLLDAVDLI